MPNIVPDFAKINLWVRDSDRKGIEEIWPRVEQIVEGAAMMAGVESKLALESGMWELLVNRTGAEALQKNLELLGEINYTPEEMGFAKKIQAATSVEQIGLDGKIKPLRETMKDPEGGSTDVADVSWNTPQISLVVTTAAKKAPCHR